MWSIDAQIRATQKRKQAAMNLSAACVEALRVPDNVAPVARFYDRTILQQEASAEMTALIGKLS